MVWAGVFKPAGLSAVTQRAPPSSSEQTVSLPSFVRCQVGLEAGDMASLTVNALRLVLASRCLQSVKKGSS